MIKRTLFKNEIYRESVYDYMYITYKEAVCHIVDQTDTGEVITINKVKEYLECDTNTAIAALGCMYHNNLVKQISSTEYMCCYNNLDLSQIPDELHSTAYDYDRNDGNDYKEKEYQFRTSYKPAREYIERQKRLYKETGEMVF